MRRFMLVAAVVAAAGAVFAGTAAAQPFTATLGATPNPVPAGGSFTLSGTALDDGSPWSNAPLFLALFTDASCSQGLLFDITFTDGSGNFAFGPYTTDEVQAALGPVTTFYAEVGLEGPFSACVPVTIGLAGEQRQPDNTFLCYSKSEQDSGMVVPTELVDQFLQGGYWKPSAVKGTPPSNAYTTAGAYYLSCNPPSSLKPTGFGVDLSGLDTYDMSSVFGGDATIFPIVG